MSPGKDTILSSGRTRCCMVLMLVALAACVPARQTQTPADMSDRLLNLLIRNQLPLSTPESALRGEVERCGQWLRVQLQKTPGETFRLEPDDKKILAVVGGASRLIVPDLFQRLDRLNAFFHLNSAVPKSMFSPESVRQLVLHPTSRAMIEELIQIDQKETITETGGIVTAPPGADHLEFHRIDSENAALVRRLQNISAPQEFAGELSLIMPSLPFLHVRAQRTLDVLTSDPNLSDDQQKEDAINSFMDLLLYYSRHSYILDQGPQYAAIAEAGISGIYMGVFHVHPPGDPPSLTDKVGSLLRKNFVIVPNADQIQVHYLDFSADPGSDPEVISFQNPSRLREPSSVKNPPREL